MDDIESLIARKILTVLKEQKPGDINELKHLSNIARQRGYNDVAEHAEEIAQLFMEEDEARDVVKRLI